MNCVADVGLWISDNPASTVERTQLRATSFNVRLMSLSHEPLFATYGNLSVDMRAVLLP